MATPEPPSPGIAAPAVSGGVRPWRTVWQLAAPAVWVIFIALCVALSAMGAVSWLLRTESGSAWLLARVPGVEVTGLRGALLSNHLEAERIEIKVGQRLNLLTLDKLVVDGLRWQWRPNSDAWIGLHVQSLSANQVVATLNPPKNKLPPASLHAPLWMQLDKLQIQTLLIGDLPALRQVLARVTVGAREGAALRIDDASFDWERAHITGDAELGTDTPFALRATARAVAVTNTTEPAWVADINATGNLLAFDVQANLQGKVQAAGSLAEQGGTLKTELRATLRTFAPWPLTALSAKTQGLNLAAFSHSWPTTALSGHVEVQSSALDAPINATVRLDNALPGRWDEQHLPVRRMDLVLRGALKDRNQVTISSFDVVLGQGQQNAGHWRGTGDWRGHALSLATTVAELRPHQLDNRASSMTLSGPLKFTWRGLPSPDGQAAPPPAAPSLELSGTLDGRMDRSERAERSEQTVQLTFDTTITAQRVELRQLRASSGTATAQVQALAQRSGNQGWTVNSEGTLKNFDPVPWWPGGADSAWRQGTHRLSADWQLVLQLPSISVSKGWLHLAQTVVGSGSLRVSDSLLAGVPVQAALTLTQTPSPAQAPSNLKGELQAAGNQLRFDVRADPLGPGDTDKLRAELTLTQLGALAPLARLWPALDDWTMREGQGSASIVGEGRWPDMRSTGQAQLQGLRVDERQGNALRVAQGSAQWRIDTASDQPLNLQLDVTRLTSGAQAIEHGLLDLQGTLTKHQLNLTATLPVKPPAWTETVMGLRPPSGTRGQLTAQGGWEGRSGGGGTWKGRLQSLNLGAWDGQTKTPGNTAPWFETSNVGAELRFSAQGALTEVIAEPGQLRMADGVTLQWEGFRLDNSGARPSFQLRAEVSAFAAAPVVARLQPGAGWGGDLRLAASVNIQAGPRFDADLVFERRSGDLFIEDGSGRQAMGLTDMRLTMSAHDGLWSFAQQLAGTSLGELSGMQRLTTTPDKRWPDASTPLTGALQGKVSNLGIWSSWIPPGWRLSGALETMATIGGQFGAPQYTGQVRGSNIGVRNLLLGLDLSGGDVAIALKGNTAQIEQFTLRGGDGTLTVSGQAELGASPKVKLQLQAQRFRVLGRVDRQLVASGQAQLDLQSERVTLDGNIRVDEGHFDVRSNGAPTLDDDVSVRAKAPVIEREEREPTRVARRDTRLNIQVDLGDKLRVRGRGLDTGLAGQLKITSPGGRLAVTGVVQALGGTYAAYGQKLEIERGILSFSGLPDNPGLDILALRPNIDTQVGVAISGSFVTPRVRLFSNPEMSDTDKLSWLVLGRASDGLGRADTTLLQRAAVALLSGEGEAPTDAFLRSIGLDELSLRQSDGDVRETVITLGKQLSRRWYLGYERGVNATSGTFQLIYRIAQRFTLRAQSGHDNSLDVIWVWRVGETAPLLGGTAAGDVKR